MEFLDESKRPVLVGGTAAPGIGVPWYCKTGFIIMMFVTVPPLALVPVWMHPKLHLVWKTVITIVIGLICWGVYRTFVAFVQQFDEATKMLNEMPF